ncbi:class I SAM-dependent methyltransferase [Erythrobacter sp. SCSIO 43205]|uniref:class I SAM-dependent methyltransferase n=1 Tax=Erythrobacter sp. SCSIO 43205 TaxID=2779361 RepID=UPI001CA8B43E|nr:class I SAM-dependent methyltransferase [Erythrobacter sp. SCSIO 43205]UAB77448.1 class I SAM-dependent methyltransferase [Erythrobacter sp. SCSIO 43205]
MTAQTSFDERRYAASVTQTLPQFWARFGGMPDVAGKHILDFGCARGGMVHILLEAGAASACGIDINPDYIAYAREKHANWGDRARFICGDIREQSLEPADIITSCNVMEHVMALPETLRALVNSCRPGGELFIGFSPLWHSPYGHHRLMNTRVPWAHLPRKNRAFLDRLVDEDGSSPETIQELGFNGATPADFRIALKGLPVEIISARRNVATHPLKQIAMKAMLIPSVFPALEKYVTIGIYWHLRRTK